MAAFRDSSDHPGPGLCPRCETRQLEWRFADGFRIGACSLCHGNWLAGADMIDLWLATDATMRKLATHDRHPLTEDLTEPAACPQCHQTMRRQTSSLGYSHQVCDQHGLWFDQGELGRIVIHATGPPGLMTRLAKLIRR